MPLDSHARADLPVRVRVPDHPLGPLEAYRTMQRNILELVPEAAYHERIISGGRWRRWHMVMDPELIERVLKTREDIYPRSDVTRRIFRPTRGQNILSAYGDTWKRQHKAMVPVFQHRNILNVASLMTMAASRWTDDMVAGGARTVDMHTEMVDLTLKIICDSALSGRDKLDREELVSSVDEYLLSISRISFLDLIGAPAWVPRPARLLDRAGPKMDRMMDRIIAARIERGPSSPPDVLDMLIDAFSASDRQAGAEFDLRNNLLVFLIAGHETTTLALTWALYLLARDGDVQARARSVARQVLGDRPATAEDVPNLRFIRQIVEEAMRLYPPGALMTRTALANDALNRVEVRRGDTIILPIYTVQRHRSLWTDPDGFNPDRFAPEMARTRHKFSYLPFSAGPRICIGMAFAMTEMVIILSTLLTRMALSMDNGFDPKPEMLLTLRPTNGMRIEMTPL